MKTVLITNVFITDEATETMVYENVLQLKKFGYPILITANFLSERIQKIIDHCFIFKENLLFKNDYKNYHWVNHYYYLNNFYINSYHSDKQKHGLGVMNAWYKAATLANILGYDYFVLQEWDIFWGDEDICNLKKFHETLKNNPEKDALLFTHYHSDFYKNICHTHATLIFKTKTFIQKFPYFSNENDYVCYIEKNKYDKFIPCEKLLYLCFVENNQENVIECDHTIDFKIIDKKTILNLKCNELNWPEPCTKTTKKLFCKSNSENIFYIFSENTSYQNKDNPNWQTIHYKIKTKARETNITHTINTGCWQLSNPIVLNLDEFPIEITADDHQTIYNSINDVNNTLIF